MNHHDQKHHRATTTGTFSAEVRSNQPGVPVSHFSGDPDGMLMYRDGAHLTVSGKQLLGGLPNHFNAFFINLPGNLPADGHKHTFTFPDSSEGVYWGFELGLNVPYTFISGSVTVSLDSEDHLHGSFECIAAFGTSKTVTVTRGKIDLKGFISVNQAAGTGYLTGDVKGGPMPSPYFHAQTVRISSQESGPIPAFWLVQGIQQDSFPPVDNLINILIDKDVKGSSFNLKGNDKVRVSFARLNAYGFAYSIDGDLNFTSLPSTGNAAGTLHCRVQKNQEAPFSIDVEFNISESTGRGT
ncbi:hypothetical protein ACUN0G_25840 [Pseudomonas sp. 32A]|uniref:hypothetical protein n=1 Tax=Pseudomonas sp. 32A TaxID=651185 RepID=UPI0040454BFE